MMNNQAIAHVRKSNGEIQTLETHSFAVANIAKRLASKLGIPLAGELIGLIHDFGKYSEHFQKYIGSATGLVNFDEDDWVDSKEQKGRIDHSSAGAQWVYNTLKLNGNKGQGELCGQILALCIASHHSGLIDCLKPDGENRFLKRIQKPDCETYLAESLVNADASVLNKAKELAGQHLLRELDGLVKKIIQAVNHGQQDSATVQKFNLGYLTRFLFSCLIDADRMDSADFEFSKNATIRSQSQPEWDIAISRLDQKLSTYSADTAIAQARKNISDTCFQRGEDKQGIYTLSVPTGGGKTLASLRLALQHAKQHKLDRIIYIIPYTSIIEQNAGEVRSILERDDDAAPWVLEHHSSLEPEVQTWRSKLTTENWDCPIVFTTMMQFLETNFSGGTRGVRRLHQLANSVLIFDEIQTLPISCTHLFCNAINFLSTYAKTTSVLCTATQPLLDQQIPIEKGRLSIPNTNHLIGDAASTQALFDQFSRVDIKPDIRPNGWACDEIAALAIDAFTARGSCLVIVNTKDWAQKLYLACQASGMETGVLFHLSTNQYPAHRKQILDKVRHRLNNKLPVLCISTQLIEAGVDISFATVVRFLAGLDSIAQAAGRCNRHGELKNAEGEAVKGEVHIVNPVKENIDILLDIKVGQDKTRRILGDVPAAELLLPATMTQYFKYYFYERVGEMSYPLKKEETNLLSLLSDNKENNYAAKNNSPARAGKRPLLMQSFMEAGRQFKAIDAPTQAVIVRHGEGKQIVTDLCALHPDASKQRYDLLKKAQKYSVNVFPNVWKQLQAAQAVIEIASCDGVYYLDERHYSEAFGLSVHAVGTMDFIGN
jgi:CRISPR-associated endonuclease/helicase Cas3